MDQWEATSTWVNFDVLKTRRKLKLTLENAPISRHQICLWTADRLVNLHRTISRGWILCIMTNRMTTEIKAKLTDFSVSKREAVNLCKSIARCTHHITLMSITIQTMTIESATTRNRTINWNRSIQAKTIWKVNKTGIKQRSDTNRSDHLVIHWNVLH